MEQTFNFTRKDKTVSFVKRNSNLRELKNLVNVRRFFFFFYIRSVREKVIGWLPKHQEPMKDAKSCEKPWGLANTI